MSRAFGGYDWSRSYEWNYDHPPPPVDAKAADVPGDWKFCSIPVDSPLGIPAGPLLNGAWCLYYASLGFDVLTYKTVRSSARGCYGMPNLQPVRCVQIRGGERDIEASREMLGSWAVSFGMPSREPDLWRPDVEATRDRLPRGKLLVVSVVGTVEPGWDIERLADDYALCARWATESGADVIETNFSCPNVSTCDGQLYQLPHEARIVAQRVRERIGQTPYLIKIGHVSTVAAARRLVESLRDVADGLAMTNSIAATVCDPEAEDRRLFGGHPRGICGDAIRAESIRQVQRFSKVIDELGSRMQIVAVGGVSSADHVRQYCRAGAGAVQVATAAMCRPEVGLEIRRQWQQVES